MNTGKLDGEVPYQDFAPSTWKHPNPSKPLTNKNPHKSPFNKQNKQNIQKTPQQQTTQQNFIPIFLYPTPTKFQQLQPQSSNHPIIPPPMGPWKGSKSYGLATNRSSFPCLGRCCCCTLDGTCKLKKNPWKTYSFCLGSLKGYTLLMRINILNPQSHGGFCWRWVFLFNWVIF